MLPFQTKVNKPLACIEASGLFIPIQLVVLLIIWEDKGVCAILNTGFGKAAVMLPISNVRF